MSFGVGTRTAIDVGLGGIIAFKTDPGAGVESVFTSAAAVYSTRIPAGSTYNGPLIRVRRSSDNTESDFSVDPIADANGNRWLDTTALLTFCGSGSGFITTWYDQSGNGRNGTQTTTAAQPRIVNAGVVHTMGGRPSANFTGSVRLATGGVFSATNSLLSVNVVTAQTPQPSNTWSGLLTFSSTAAGGTNFWWIGQFQDVVGKARFGWEASGQLSDIDNVWTTNLATYTATSSVTRGLIINRNGTQIGSRSLTAAAFSNTFLNIGWSTAAGWIGFISEAVVFLSDLQVAPRQALERSQGAAFGITVA